MNSIILEFDGCLLERGFWIYVWEVREREGGTRYYVGRTGDESSPNAGSPMRRLGSHFSRNPRGRALLRNLEQAGVTAETCHFKLHALGPIHPEQTDFDKHRPYRDRVATLESVIASSLKGRGFEVMGTHPRPRVPIEEVVDLAEEIVVRVLGKEEDGPR